METNDILFWNVDTQFDFVEPGGKLYVKGAERLKPIWKEIGELARDQNIKVVNTADFHYPDSKELSQNPDFISTFPEHCMANTEGARYIAETAPANPVILDWDDNEFSAVEVKQNRNIVIRKDAFDVFVGNSHTEAVLDLLAPQKVVVYGLTTNVCVAAAVAGLVKRVKRVFVIEDAIKELPNIDLPFDDWKKWGVTLIQSAELKHLL